MHITESRHTLDIPYPPMHLLSKPLFYGDVLKEFVELLCMYSAVFLEFQKLVVRT